MYQDPKTLSFQWVGAQRQTKLRTHVTTLPNVATHWGTAAAALSLSYYIKTASVGAAGRGIYIKTWDNRRANPWNENLLPQHPSRVIFKTQPTELFIVHLPPTFYIITKGLAGTTCVISGRQARLRVRHSRKRSTPKRKSPARRAPAGQESLGGVKRETRDGRLTH